MQKKYRVLVVILLLVIAALLGIILWQYFSTITRTAPMQCPGMR